MGMETLRWQRIKRLFEKALEKPPEERSAFLKVACAADGRLLREVSSLLRAAEDDDFLEEPIAERAMQILFNEARPGERDLSEQRIGPYRLKRCIGRGGMAVVYLAERDDGMFDRQVAVKIAHADSPMHFERLEAERRILAGLRHPNITRLYGGGLTPSGRPYFAMEYVEGAPLTTYADAHRLSVHERLTLFLSVCDTVAYAHRNLVIHRDLKPSNILVSETDAGAPSVRLLDFGIAGLLHAGRASSSVTDGRRPLTLECASPEQLENQSITTASDIYQLGLLLFELLTGHHPLEGLTDSRSDLIRAVLHTPPPFPAGMVLHAGHSDAASVADARRTTPKLLYRQMKGDLDAIVVKTLQKDPERRYTSVDRLADDIRRHESNHPILARPAPASYRLLKYIRRRRVRVAGLTLLFLAVIGGLGATIRQARIAEVERRRAEQHFAKGRALASALIFDIHDLIADLNGATRAREQLILRALQYLDDLDREVGKDATIRLELAQAYRRIGDVTGNPNGANLGQSAKALKLYRHALALAQSVPEATDTSAQPTLTIGLIREKMSDVLSVSGNLPAADSSMRRALQAFQYLAILHPNDPRYQIRAAIGLIKLGDVTGNANFPNLQRPEDALVYYTAAQPILTRLLASETPSDRAFRYAALVDERLGTIYEQLNRWVEARSAFRRSLSNRQLLADAHPGNTDIMRDLGVIHEKIAGVEAHVGNLDKAQSQFETAHAIYSELAQLDGQNANAQQTLAISHLHLGDLYWSPDHDDLGNPAKALYHYRRAVSLLKPLITADPDNTRVRNLIDLLNERIGKLPH